jgi:tRNA A37 N6-isopentenylltransferase MiaA
MRRDDLPIVLAPFDRSALFARIAARFDDMLRRGFVDEVGGCARGATCTRGCHRCASSVTGSFGST